MADHEVRAEDVVEALCRVMRDLPGIGRDQRSEQGYQYRGIEQITKAAQALFAKHGVVFVPRVVERYPTKDLTINGRPWTEEQMLIAYTVYGPGGIDDKIEVGPVLGLGRDNSDKGANKALTQAFKYALIQTLCIGDGEADADRDHAHEADAVEGEDVLVRRRLHKRAAEASRDVRDALRSYCDEHGIPRVPARMDDEQVDAVIAFLDLLENGEVPAPTSDASDTAPEAPERPAPAEAEQSPPDAREAPLPPCAICGSSRSGRAVERGVTRCSDAPACTKRVEEKAGG